MHYPPHVGQAPGPANEVRLENIWVDGAVIIIVHIELIVTINLVPSSLRTWPLRFEGLLSLID